LIGRGVRVALGTDSLASNPDLSILAEARFLRAIHPDLDGSTILKMATLWGAEALGWADECGNLDAGKSADFVVIPSADSDGSDPYERWLESDRDVAEVWFRGQRVWPANSSQ
jgi:aminodeoxyfutalosine deaminase